MRSLYDPARRAGSDLAIGSFCLDKATGLSNWRGAIVSSDEPRRQCLQHFGRGCEIALQRVDAVEPAFVVIEVGEIKAHLALTGHSDLDQPATQGQTVDGVPEHDAADKIKDDIGPLTAGGRTDFSRQILCAEDQFLGDVMDRCVRMRRAQVGTDHAGAEAAGDLRRGAADAAACANQQNGLTGLKTCRFEAAPSSYVVDPNRRRLVEAEDASGAG